MKRNKMLIISITSIIIITLALIGITFGYYLTKITGNESNKSVSVESAIKEVEIKEIKTIESGVLNGEGTSKIIEPGYENIKVFTVQNIGNTEAVYHIYLDNVVNTFNRTQDITYTLYRKTGNNTIDTDNLSDNDIVKTGTFPKMNNYILTNETITNPNNYYTYALKVNYINSETEDQSEDQGKTFSYKVQLHAEVEIPYSSNKSSLAYNIINNAIIGTNGTTLKAVPETTPAVEISYVKANATNVTNEKELDMSTQSYWFYGNTYNDAQPWNGGSSSNYVSECSDTIVGKYISYPTDSTSWYVISCKSSTVAITGDVEVEYDYEQELSVTQDDYGASYYYRGKVEDNYVNFAGMCWRIVRIEGDGSVKITLAAQKNCSEITDSDTGTAFIGTGNYGYDSTSKSTSGSTLYKMNYLNPVTSNTSSMVKAFYDFQTNKLASYTDKLKSGDWCLGDTAYTRSGSSKSDYTYTLLTDISSNYLSKTSFYYDAYGRITGNSKDGYSATLKCNGTKLDKFATVAGVSSEAPMYVSALTIDEVAYAGGSWTGSNTNYYLNNNASSNYWWTLSPSGFYGSNDCAFNVRYDGGLDNGSVDSDYDAFRPAVSLASSAKITSGDGTKNNPYVIG